MEGQTVDKVRSTPAVRAFAKSNNLNINNIKGTGNEGRVTRDDVQRFMDGGSQQAESKPAGNTISSGVAQPPLTGVT